jgi:hypothetical protein
LHASKELGHASHELWLNIKATRHERLAAIIVNLEGTLDDLNVRELLDRIGYAVKRAQMDIILNFEHLQQATPQALRTLLDGDLLKSIAPFATIRYRKFKEAFAPALQDFSLSGLDLLHEDWQDA